MTCWADRVHAFLDGSSLAQDDLADRMKSVAEENDSGRKQMNIVTAVRGALVAGLFGAALLTATPHATATPIHTGRCLFGHVNANPNSACRGSDSANWPRVPADSNGHPLKECLPGNDGESVSTEDVHGGRHWFICGHESNITGEELWEWKEVLLGRSR